MIRIETTATFDAEGHVEIPLQSAVPVSPGTYRISMTISDPVTAQQGESHDPTVAEYPELERIDGILVYKGVLLEDPETVRQRLDDERARQLLFGPSE
jgi:hypothetical protein